MRSPLACSAWIFGGPGANFVGTMQRLEREKETVDVVAGWRQRRRTPAGADPVSGEVARIALGVVTTNAFVLPAVLLVLAV